MLLFQEDNISKLCQEILDKWKVFQTEEENSHKTVLDVAEDVDVKLARLLETQAKPATVIRNNYTDEEKRIREAILSQYGQMSDEEGEGENDTEVVKENGLMKNMNAASVQQAEREKREKAKIESQKKKEKDKEDRFVSKKKLNT